jgi:hypothetical protein
LHAHVQVLEKRRDFVCLFVLCMRRNGNKYE